MFQATGQQLLGQQNSASLRNAGGGVTCSHSLRLFIGRVEKRLCVQGLFKIVHE